MADASEGTAGAPKVLGPQGASKPASFGPPGGQSTASTSAPRAAGTSSPSGSGPTPASKPAAKEPTAKEPAPKAAAEPSPPEDDPAVDLPYPIGTVARITGLKSETASKLNGSLCAVLRAAETSDRVVVKTTFGEKSLKPSNLEVGKCVYPRGSGYVLGVLLLIALGTIADAARNRGLNGLSTATIPVLATIVIVFTLYLSFYLHRPCKTDDSWVPAVSMLSSSMPARHVYRGGFIGTGVLVAVMVWLTSELLVTQLVEPLPPPPDLFMNVSVAAGGAAPAPVVAEDSRDSDAEAAADIEESDASSQEESSASTDQLEHEQLEAGSGAASAEASSGGAANTTNATARRLAQWRNETAMLEWAPASLIRWGYISAAGLAAQGLFAFEDRLCVQSALHVGGFSAFIAGALQHAILAHSVLGSTAARTMTEAWPPVKHALKARRYIAEGGPIAMMIVVLISQSTTSFSRPTARASRSTTLTTRGLFKESGLGKSLAMMQWAALACTAVFYSTFALDFWVGSLLAGQTLIEVDM